MAQKVVPWCLRQDGTQQAARRVEKEEEFKADRQCDCVCV